MVSVMKKFDTGVDDRTYRIDFACVRSEIYHSKDKKEDENKKWMEIRKYNFPFSWKGRMVENSSH